MSQVSGSEPLRPRSGPADSTGDPGRGAPGESEYRSSSAGTGHYYTTTKNRRLHPEKMEVMKYDPRVRKHVAYKETKIK